MNTQWIQLLINSLHTFSFQGKCQYLGMAILRKNLFSQMNRPQLYYHIQVYALCNSWLKIGMFCGCLCLQHFSVAKDPYPVDNRIDIQHYAFHLTLSNHTDEIIGKAEITVQFTDQISSFFLDLIGKQEEGRGMQVSNIIQNNTSIQFSHKNDKLQVYLEGTTQSGDVHTFTIHYKGIPADGLIIAENKYGDRTFFGDNWPDRARHWLPTVDHPSDKATCEFIITAPEYYQVIANGKKLEESVLSLGMQGERMKITHWGIASPIPTKVMVIGVARFAIQYLHSELTIPVQSWVYPEDRNHGFRDFEQAPDILEFFIHKIGPYPYEKLANVQANIPYSGMENATNIFYGESTLTGKGSREGLMAHEIAHQWFGNAVTEADWHHVWLSEGLSTYLAELYIEYTYGRDSMNQRMEHARQQVFTYHTDFPESSVVDTKVVNLNKLLNANSYQKGAWILHMLRRQIGDEIFWKGLQQFYKKYCHKNAMTEDFRKVMETVSGEDLSWFFKQWVYQTGQPELDIDWNYKAIGKKLEVYVNQKQKSNALFRSTLELGIYYKGKKEPDIRKLNLDNKESTFTLKLEKAPASVIADPNIWLLMRASYSTK